VRRFLPVLVAIGMSVAANAAVAQSIFEKLVMPGPLAKAHQKYEKSCNKCHTPFRRDTQSSLCLDCHDKVAADRKQSRGFHAKNPTAAKSECRHCHKEHKGADADITGLDKSTFDHRQTDFQLNGQHATATCESCHKAGEAYRKAPLKCIGCHKPDDPHKGRLGEQCQSCHNENSWKNTSTFDHSKTKFPLVDAHQKVTCEKCHAGEVYKGVPAKCSGCHSLQDVHKGAYGTRCESCHTPKSWKTIRFDHDRDTKFPLRGGHKTAKCESCHLDNIYSVRLSTKCSGCHGKQDPHNGSLGSNCAKCHNESSWHARVAFDHDLTRFPLIGLHAAVGCASCHRTKTYREAPKTCSACHADKYHQGRVGSQCARCHTPNGWDRWIFDHTRDARFELTGAHHGITCHACHKAPAGKGVSAPKACIACHAQDDVHHGAFGSACDNCHATESFRRPRFQR
jgi:hypothetical protein